MKNEKESPPPNPLQRGTLNTIHKSDKHKTTFSPQNPTISQKTFRNFTPYKTIHAL